MLPEKVKARRGRFVARLDRGNCSLDIICNRRFYGVVNGSMVLASRNEQEFRSEMAIPAALLMEHMDCPKDPVTLRYATDYTDLLGDVIDHLSKSEKVKVVLLETKPDEITQNPPAQVQYDSRLIPLYRYALKKVSEDLEEVGTLAGSLLNTQIPGSMWGAKDVSKILASVRRAAAKDEDALNQIEGALERSESRCGILSDLLATHKSYPQAVQSACLEIRDNFTTIKKHLAELIKVLHRLYLIDSVFKKHTGYPATWFYDSSVFYDFQYCYETLLRDLLEFVRFESTLIEPLAIRYP